MAALPARTAPPASTAQPAQPPSPRGGWLQPSDLPTWWDSLCQHPALQQSANQPPPVLSLDCFDTLLWRRVHAPTDVFDLLDGSPLWQQHGLTPQVRRQAERTARRRSLQARGHTEVHLRDIYRQALFGSLSAQHESAEATRLEAFVAAELAAEAQVLFAFAPVARLAAAARDRGWQVRVVSDMYLRASELQALLSHCGIAVDSVDTSADHACAKRQGLLARLAAAWQMPMSRVVHLGDHPIADVEAAQASGAQGWGLRRGNGVVQRSVRQAAEWQSRLLNAGERGVPRRTPWHAVAAQFPDAQSLQERIGWHLLAPVLSQFQTDLADTVRRLQSQGVRVRPVFLLRDAYLSFRIWDALAPHTPDLPPATALHISRSTALASTWIHREAIDQFLYDTAGNLDAQAQAEHLGVASLDELPQQMEAVIARAHRLRAGLLCHLKTRIAVAPGDHLLLVDLGYRGTIQDALASWLPSALECTLSGYYLLLRPNDRVPRDKQALLATDTIPDRSLECLAQQVQLLEQLCRSPQGSVLDYAADGTPQCADLPTNELAHTLREQIQTATLDAVLVAQTIQLSNPPSNPQSTALPWTHFKPQIPEPHIPALQGADPHTQRAQEAAGFLGRLLLQPTADELDLHRHWTHDVNNGSARHRWLTHPCSSLPALRQGGFLSLQPHHHRTLAHDLHHAGPTAAALSLQQSRWGLQCDAADFLDPSGPLDGVLQWHQHTYPVQWHLMQAIDGWRVAVARFPAGVAPQMLAAELPTAAAIALGSWTQWVQVQSAGVVDALRQTIDPYCPVIPGILTQVEAVGGEFHPPTLWRFPAPDSFLRLHSASIGLPESSPPADRARPAPGAHPASPPPIPQRWAVRIVLRPLTPPSNPPRTSPLTPQHTPSRRTPTEAP